jgi:hypothetical protein
MSCRQLRGPDMYAEPEHHPRAEPAVPPVPPSRVRETASRSPLNSDSASVLLERVAPHWTNRGQHSIPTSRSSTAKSSRSSRRASTYASGVIKLKSVDTAR